MLLLYKEHFNHVFKTIKNYIGFFFLIICTSFLMCSIFNYVWTMRSVFDEQIFKNSGKYDFQITLNKQENVTELIKKNKETYDYVVVPFIEWTYIEKQIPKFIRIESYKDDVFKDQNTTFNQVYSFSYNKKTEALETKEFKNIAISYKYAQKNMIDGEIDWLKKIINKNHLHQDLIWKQKDNFYGIRASFMTSENNSNINPDNITIVYLTPTLFQTLLTTTLSNNYVKYDMFFKNKIGSTATKPQGSQEFLKSPRGGIFYNWVIIEKIIILSNFLIILTVLLFISLFYLKKEINVMKKKFGILKAMGLSNAKIINIIVVNFFIFTIITGILGFGFSYCIEKLFLKNANLQLLLPIKKNNFHTINFAINCIIIPMTLVFFAYIMAVFIISNYKTTDLIYNSSKIKTPQINSLITKTINQMNFKIKFFFILVSRSLWKLLISMLSFLITAFFISFVFFGILTIQATDESLSKFLKHSDNKFDYIVHKSLNDNNNNKEVSFKFTKATVKWNDITKDTDLLIYDKITDIEKIFNYKDKQLEKQISDVNNFNTKKIIIGEKMNQIFAGSNKLTINKYYEIEVGLILKNNTAVDWIFMHSDHDLIKQRIIPETSNARILFIKQRELKQDEKIIRILNQPSNNLLLDVFLDIFKIILGITIFCVFVILFMMINLIIEENMKFILSMKAFGYNNLEIVKMILVLYFVILFSVFFVSYFVSYVVWHKLIKYILVESNFLFILNFDWMSAVLVFSIFSIMTIIAFVSCFYHIKKISLLKIHHVN